ncbi:MAG: ATP-dependent Clp protease ATP-binding subunit [Bacilli bacterium]
MFGNFTEEARKTLVLAKKEMYELKHPYVGSEHLLLALLKEKNTVSDKLKQYKLDYNIFKNELIKVVGIGKKESTWFLYTPLLKRVIENSIIDSKENNQGEVTPNHLFASLLEEGEGVALRIMLGMNVDLDELYNDFSSKLIVIKNKKNKKLMLDELGIDLNKKALNKEIDPVIGRDKEIKRVLEILCRRTKNNPLLIGDAGVGKTAIVEELSRMIAFGEVPSILKNKRIVSINMSTTVAGTKYRGEFEERIGKILKEIEEDDSIILFIDEIHTLVGAGGAEGAIDAANIFKPALARNKIRCIGATTIDEYKKFIEKDGALDRRFQRVLIETPDKKTLKEILLKLKSIYEDYHNVILDENIIDLIIYLSEKYIYDRNQPDKAIDLLDEVCASVRLKESSKVKKYNLLNKEIITVISKKNELLVKDKFSEASIYKTKENELMNKINNLELELYKEERQKVDNLDLAKIVSTKTGIPIYELINDSIDIIKNIEKSLSKEIKGQERAIKELINITKKIKLGFNEENKCYSLLFCGPTGVGKTHLAKLFGSTLVSEKNVIKLDMSEFSEAHTVSKIIGSPPGYVGYSDNKNILEEIRNKPYSVLIVDELEKAHSSIIDLFYQILDESKIKDSLGRIVRFDNVIIIMTSNVGFNKESVGFSKTNQSIVNRLKETFSVPFLNRIDNIISFNLLSENNILNIIEEKLNLIKQKYLKKSIKLKISSNIKNEICLLSNYQEFGARKINKIIKDNLESIIIENILDNKKIINIKTIKQESIV